MDYCQGNFEILKSCSFAELCEIVEYVAEQHKENELLKAYQASYCALKGVSFADFKKSVEENAYKFMGMPEQSPQALEHKIQHYIDDYTWEVV